MREAYNYSAVETHKQKLFIPYFGIEITGWSTLFIMLGGVLVGVFVVGYPLSLLFGDFGFVVAIAITAVVEIVAVMFLTEIDRDTGKSKLMSFYYTSIKRYRIIYDSKGNSHYISPKKEGVIFKYVR